MLLTNIVLAAACALAAPPPDRAADILAQRATIPIVATAPLAGGVVAVHSDGSGTWVAIDQGELMLSIIDQRTGPGSGPSLSPESVQQGGTAPVSTVTSSWVDVNGQSRSVTTPIVSTTAQGVEKAIETHKRIVDAMQKLYPPYVVK